MQQRTDVEVFEDSGNKKNHMEDVKNSVRSLWIKFLDFFRDTSEKQIILIQHRGRNDYVIWLRPELGSRAFEVSFVRSKSVAKDIVEMLAPLDIEGRKRVIRRLNRRYSI